MNSNAADVEEVIIQGLGNQERRKILKIIKLAEKGAIYSDILAELELNSGLLNYHLRQLEGLITKSIQGRYFLTPLGEKALRGLYSMTENLENGYQEYLTKAKTRQRRTIFPKLSSILTIIASCISCSYAVIMSLAVISWFASGNPTKSIPIIIGVLTAVCGYVGFAVGLTAGRYLFKRIHFRFSLSTICFLLISSLLFMVTSAVTIPIITLAGFLLTCVEIPLLISCILSIIFSSISKGEFVK